MEVLDTMATITRVEGKNGVGWKATVRRRPHPTQSKTFKRKTDAQSWARDVEARIDSGKFRDDSLARRHTVSDLIDAYLANVLPHLRDQRMPRLHMEKWRELIGDFRLAELTPMRIIEARERLAAEKYRGKPKSGPTLNRYLATLSKALTVAEREFQWIESNPAKKVTKYAESRGREVFLSKEQAIQLVEVCKESRNRYLPTVVLIAVSTGMRLGEIMTLVWSDIDLDAGMLIIQKSKSDKPRSMPLLDLACMSLRELLPDKSWPSGLVFPGRDPAKPMIVTKAWEGAREGFGMPELRMHDLRHSLASFLVADGRSLPEIADILGHKSYQSTARYAHLTDRHKRPILLETVGRVFEADKE